MTALVAVALALAWTVGSCWQIARRQVRPEASRSTARVVPNDGLLSRLQDIELVGTGELHPEDTDRGPSKVAARTSLGAVVRDHAEALRARPVARRVLVAITGPALVGALALAPPTTVGRAVAWYVVLFAPAWVAGFAYWSREPTVRFAGAVGLGHVFVVYSLHWIASAWWSLVGPGLRGPG